MATAILGGTPNHGVYAWPENPLNEFNGAGPFLKGLNEGQRISFDVEPDKKGKGPKAVNLVVQG